MNMLQLTTETGTDILPLAYLEREIIHSALRHYNWNIRKTARQLGIGTMTLYRRMDTYGIGRE